jgi:hypothetical protein
VLRALEGMLAELAPFDAGEVVLQAGRDRLRLPLGDQDELLLDEDLERRLLRQRAPLRVDDLLLPSELPETVARASGDGSDTRLVQLGYRSLLALPLFEREERLGLLVLACREAWGFVTVSLRAVVPVAQMAGICLSRALLLPESRDPGETSPESPVDRTALGGPQAQHGHRRRRRGKRRRQEARPPDPA